MAIVPLTGPLGAVVAWTTRVASARPTWLTGIGTRALSRALGYTAVTRVALFIVAASAIRFLQPSPQPAAQIWLGRSLSALAWVRWDAAWYLSVVEHGYSFHAGGQSNVAFFPVFPLLIKLVTAALANPVVAGLLVANGAAVGAVVALWAWTRAEAGVQAATGAVRWLMVYPFSFFFHSIYAEPLFFLLVTLALMAARRHRWALAGGWGGLAAATRPLGILLLPAFLWGLWQDKRGGRRIRVADALSLALTPSGLVVYMIFLWYTFGNGLAFWEAHVIGWHVQVQEHLARHGRDVYALFAHGPRWQGYMQLLSSVRVFFPVAFIFLTIQVFRHLGAVCGIYTGLAVVVGTLYGFESVGREYLAAVPAFAVIGVIGRDRGGEGLRLLSFGLQIIFLFAFVTGHFVG